MNEKGTKNYWRVELFGIKRREELFKLFLSFSFVFKVFGEFVEHKSVNHYNGIAHNDKNGVQVNVER